MLRAMRFPDGLRHVSWLEVIVCIKDGRGENCFARLY